MAKLMVMINIPDHEYEELSVRMKMRKATKDGQVNFNVPKSPDGFDQVEIANDLCGELGEGDTMIFELIGVRP